MNKIEKFEKEQQEIKEKIRKGEIKSVKCPVCAGKGYIKKKKEITDCSYCDDVGTILIETEIKENRTYDINYTSALLQLNPQTVKKFIREGKIKAKKVGRRYLILGRNILEYLKP